MHGLPLGWMVVVTGLAAAQLAAAVRFFGRRGRALPALPSPAPSLAVVVAFKGDSPRLAENAASLVAQEYPGAIEWAFAVGEPGDPARPVLERLAAGRPGVKVVVATQEPKRSSAKAVNLLAGAAAVKDAEVLLFADADLAVRPDWARLMVAGLREDGVVASTAAMVYEPGSFSSELMLTWMAYGLPWFEPMGIAVGQSLAIRRADFESLGVAAAWRESVSEDLALSVLARKKGGVSVVMDAAPKGLDAGTPAEALSRLARWVALFRFYDPRVWALGLVTTAIKLGALAQAFSRPFCWPLAAVVVLGDMAALLFGLLGMAGPRRDAAACALYAPLLLAVDAAVYGFSLFAREIAWSGWTYHLDGPRADRGTDAACAARRVRARKLGLSLGGGALLGLAYLPGAWGLLAWVGFVPLLTAIDDERPGDAAVWGAAFGLVAYAFGAYWMYPFLRSFLGAGPPEACVWFLGIMTLQGLRWAAVAAAAACAPAGPRRALLFCLGAAIVEPFLPTLFPAPFATTQHFHLPTLQTMELFGEAAPAFLVLAANAALFLLIARPRRVAFAAVVAALVAGNELWGRSRLAAIETLAASRPTLRAGLVQGGRRPEQKPAPDRFAQDLPLYRELTKRAVAAGASGLVVWPESTYAGVLDYDLGAPGKTLSDGLPLDAALKAEVGGDAPVLISAIGRGADGRERNVSALAGPSGALGVTEKTVLAPFGEYMPGGRALAWLYRLSPQTAHLSPGTGSRALTLGDARLGVLICYESFVPGPAERLAGQSVNLLIAQTNDAWFGGSAEPYQHLRLSALRAIENRLAVIHAANTGISGLIAPSGRVLAMIPEGRADALAWEAPLMPAPARGPRAARCLFALSGALWAAGTIWSLKGARA